MTDERKAGAGFAGAHGSAEWLQIQLAPKDGTRVLLWCGDEVEVGYWSTSSWVRNVKPDGTLTDGAWIIYENRSDTIELAPTHWMALPLPPNNQARHDANENPECKPECNGGVASSAVLAIAVAALQRIANCEDAPDIDVGGERQFGLHCGVEDRGCQDRYQGADYGYSVGVDRTLEWASSEAKYALEQMATDQS